MGESGESRRKEQSGPGRLINSPALSRRAERLDARERLGTFDVRRNKDQRHEMPLSSPRTARGDDVPNKA